MCWGFASLKSLETYLALNELGNYDFSEMHLDYIQSDLMYGYRELHTGGNFSEFKEYITVSGVVLESDVPYREHSEEEYSKFTDIRKITEGTDIKHVYVVEKTFLNYNDEYRLKIAYFCC